MSQKNKIYYRRINVVQEGSQSIYIVWIMSLWTVSNKLARYYDVCIFKALNRITRDFYIYWSTLCSMNISIAKKLSKLTEKSILMKIKVEKKTVTSSIVSLNWCS